MNYAITFIDWPSPWKDPCLVKHFKCICHRCFAFVRVARKASSRVLMLKVAIKWQLSFDAMPWLLDFIDQVALFNYSWRINNTLFFIRTRRRRKRIPLSDHCGRCILLFFIRTRWRRKRIPLSDYCGRRILLFFIRTRRPLSDHCGRHILLLFVRTSLSGDAILWRLEVVMPWSLDIAIPCGLIWASRIYNFFWCRRTTV
jgi:hypothetical protein